MHCTLIHRHMFTLQQQQTSRLKSPLQVRRTETKKKKTKNAYSRPFPRGRCSKYGICRRIQLMNSSKECSVLTIVLLLPLALSCVASFLDARQTERGHKCVHFSVFYFRFFSLSPLQIAFFFVSFTEIRSGAPEPAPMKFCPSYKISLGLNWCRYEWTNSSEKRVTVHIQL